MDQEKLHHPEDDLTAVDSSMISSTSPYQPTTEPVPHRRSVVGGLVADMRFIKSIPGILKAIEIVFSIVTAICVGCVASCGSTCAPVNFMQFVSISAIILVCILYIIFSLQLQSNVECIDWPLTDFMNMVIFFVFYLVASSVLAANLNEAASKAATAFGFFTMAFFASSSWLAYKTYMLERRKRHSPVSHIKGVNEHMETQELA